LAFVLFAVMFIVFINIKAKDGVDKIILNILVLIISLAVLLAEVAYLATGYIYLNQTDNPDYLNNYLYFPG